MRAQCKHGFPFSWQLEGPDPEPTGLFMQIKITCCQQCVEDGTAKQFAELVETEVKRHLTNKWPVAYDRGADPQAE